MNPALSILGLIALSIWPANRVVGPSEHCIFATCASVQPNQGAGSIDSWVTLALPGRQKGHIPGRAAPAARTGSAGQPGPSAPTAPTNPALPINSLVAAVAERIRAVECVLLAVGPPPPCVKHPAAPAAPAPPAISAAAIHQVVVSYLQRLPLPAPGIHLNPAQPAIVNFPTIINADPPPTTQIVITQPGFPRINLIAHCQWHWDFGDGATTSTDWPGRPYDGTLPADNPQHYLLHTYRNPATLTVTVTGVWSATYTVAGTPGTTTMTGTVSRTSSTTLTIREYAANLIP